jgi:tRNA(Ile)-lysidine synthase
MPPPARGRERLANGPVDLCSEQVAAGVNGIHPQPIVVVRGAGTYDFNGVRFTVELFPWDNSMPLKQPQGTLILDADRLSFPFVCRKWRQGDWLNPLGMRGKKKVSDLFADLKYDAFAKDAAVIVVDTQTEDYAAQQHIAALMGVRIDDRYKVTQSTETVIRLTVI